MPRKTSNPTLALRRLIQAAPGVELEHLGGQDYALDYGEIHYVGTSRRCLARLVEALQYAIDQGGFGWSRERIARVMRLTSISDYGLTGPQWQTVSEVTLQAVRPSHDNPNT